MKFYAILLLFIFSFSFPQNGMAKKDTTLIYCNADLKKTNAKYALYYAKIYKNADGTIGVQQFKRDGTRYLTGSFTKKNCKVRQGLFQYYDYDGILKKTGAFDQDLATGIWKYIAPNGTVTGEGLYENGERNGTWNFHTKEGLKSSSRAYKNDKFHGEYFKWVNDTLVTKGQYVNDEKDGFWQNWYKTGVKNDEGNYNNGDRTGEWKFYFRSGNIAAVELYAKGEAIKVEWFDESGNSVEPTEPLEIDPSFEGGQVAMNQFIRDNVSYPSLAMEMGEQGIVYVSFYIELDGSLSEVRIRKGISEALDNESIRVVKSMPNWIPANYHNRAMRVNFTLPIHYRLG